MPPIDMSRRSRLNEIKSRGGSVEPDTQPGDLAHGQDSDPGSRGAAPRLASDKPAQRYRRSHVAILRESKELHPFYLWGEMDRPASSAAVAISEFNDDQRTYLALEIDPQFDFATSEILIGDRPGIKVEGKALEEILSIIPSSDYPHGSWEHLSEEELKYAQEFIVSFTFPYPDSSPAP